MLCAEQSMVISSSLIDCWRLFECKFGSLIFSLLIESPRHPRERNEAQKKLPKKFLRLPVVSSRIDPNSGILEHTTIVCALLLCGWTGLAVVGSGCVVNQGKKEKKNTTRWEVAACVTISNSESMIFNIHTNLNTCNWRRRYFNSIFNGLSLEDDDREAIWACWATNVNKNFSLLFFSVVDEIFWVSGFIESTFRLLSYERFDTIHHHQSLLDPDCLILWMKNSKFHSSSASIERY